MNSFDMAHCSDIFLNNSHVGIIVVDIHRKILFANELLYKKMGCTEEELLNHSTEIIYNTKDDFVKFYELAIAPTLAGESVCIDYQFKTRDGTPFWAQVCGDVMNEEQDILWTIVDITKKRALAQENDKLRERIQLALIGYKAGMYEWNMLDDSAYYSDEWKLMLGYEDTKLDAHLHTWKDLVHPDDIDAIMIHVQNTVDKHLKTIETVHRLKHKKGHWIWILGRGNIEYNADAKALKMVGIHTDITEQKKRELKLKHQAQIIAQTHDSVISIDVSGKILSWNKGSERLFAYTSEEIIGQSINILQYQKDLMDFSKIIGALQKDSEIHKEIRLIKKTGESIYVDLSLSLLRDEDEKIIGIIGYAQDISQRKEMEEKLHFQVQHDVLTGLPNRTLFNDRLEQAIIKTQRNKAVKIALFFIDLDRFKEINDTLGHNIGDGVLKEVAFRMSQEIRQVDTLSRLGGDEFTIIVEELHRVEDSSLLAQKILDALAEPMIIDSHKIFISASIGISICPDNTTILHDLIKYADQAMYRAKAKGCNNFQYFTA